MSRFALLALAATCILASSSTVGRAAETATPNALETDAPQQAELATLVERGVAFLAGTQAEDGSWSRASGTGPTSLVATALLRNGRTPADPLVAKALEFLEGKVQNDGGIYQPKSRHRNYETCLAVLCFSEANRAGSNNVGNNRGKYDTLLDNAEAFLKDLQWDGGEGHDVSSTSYGGAGYGSHSRPDLSNTTFLIDALKATGNGPEDPAMQAALAFVSRCQNLETQHNETKFAAKNPDGGFYYTVAAGGSSQAGETPEGGLRSYGSMTYAGLKSMLYAGVDADDPRVEAALKWVQKHYDLDENPGMGTAGLYYYYHTFAKALDAVGEDKITDSSGNQHNWRQDLINELATRQQPGGSWLNENERWLESDPNLVTGYVLLALSHCRQNTVH